MALMIQLPDSVEADLRDAARQQQVEPEELAIQILKDVLHYDSWESPPLDPSASLEEVVAMIKQAPPNPRAIRRAKGSLRELLANSPVDPDFDVEGWQREWDKVEGEMKGVRSSNPSEEKFDPLL